ncbi:hypothetical protein PRIPAC_85616, partial [Pristionchus pacificus]
EAIGYIAQAAGLTIEPVQFEIPSRRDFAYGEYKNGSWSGALGYLAHGLFDVACLFYQRNDERDRDFHFTSSFQRTQFVMFSRLKTEPMPPTLGSPYEVWIAALATIIAQSIALFIISRYSEDSDNRSLHWHRRWETFTTIEEAAQLIENGELTFVITLDGTFYRQLFTSQDPSFARLRRAFEKGGRRNVTAHSNEEAVRFLQDPGFIFGTHSESSSFQFFRDVCDIFFIYEGLPTQETHFITRKDWPFNHRIDSAIVRSDAFLNQ